MGGVSYCNKRRIMPFGVSADSRASWGRRAGRTDLFTATGNILAGRLPPPQPRPPCPFFAKREPPPCWQTCLTGEVNLGLRGAARRRVAGWSFECQAGGCCLALDQLLLRLLEGFGGTHPICLVRAVGEDIPRGRGPQLIVLDVLKRRFVGARPGGVRLGPIECGLVRRGYNYSPVRPGLAEPARGDGQACPSAKC